MPVVSVSIPADELEKIDRIAELLSGRSATVRKALQILITVLSDDVLRDRLIIPLAMKYHTEEDPAALMKIGARILLDLSDGPNWGYIQEQCKANNVTPGVFLDKMLTWARNQCSEKS